MFLTLGAVSAEIFNFAAATPARLPRSPCIPPPATYYRGMAGRCRENPYPLGRVLRVALGLTLLALAGCQAPPPPSGPTELTLHVPDYEAFVDSSLSTLRLYDFKPDRVDRVGGLIVTAPTTSGQWFEWWRVDSLGAYQTCEASLHTTRRIVTVNIVPAAADTGVAPVPEPVETSPTTAPTGGTYRVAVQVDKQRYSAPERQITTASGALAIYSERTPTVEGLRGPRSRRVEWVPLGRDGLLESFLLAKLAAARPEVTPSEPRSVSDRTPPSGAAQR